MESQRSIYPALDFLCTCYLIWQIEACNSYNYVGSQLSQISRNSSNLTVPVMAFVKLNITKQNPEIISVDKRLIGMKTSQQGKEGDKRGSEGQGN